MVQLLLIRHGESEHSQRGMIAGYASCLGLTAPGFRQAQRLADRRRCALMGSR
jgi:broad specificity phosphatase PhoE